MERNKNQFKNLQSASKLLRHSYPLESISSSVRKWPPPPHPQDNVVFFCFLRALSTAVQHWLGWGREGYPGNVLFGQVFFANNECVVASVLCWQLSQLILSPIVAVRTLKKSPHRNKAIFSLRHLFVCDFCISKMRRNRKNIKQEFIFEVFSSCLATVAFNALPDSGSDFFFVKFK